MIELARYYTPRDMGTFGILRLATIEFYTVELPWRRNRVKVSCIPEGTYELHRCMFYGGDGIGGEREDYLTYEVCGVVARSEIKFHIANEVGELAGCIAIGEALGIVRGHWAVLNSRDAIQRFIRAMDGREIDQIRIYQARGET